MSKKKVTDEELVDLHTLLTKAYNTELQRQSEEGAIAPQLLSSAAAFLKANGISCVPTVDDEEITELQRRAQDALSYPFEVSKDN